jgi:beta-lactamase regulating signal transducer with metallopeptidase domain
MSYVGGIVIAIVLTARVFLKKFPKKYSYLLWIVPLIRLVFPFSIESVISLIPFNPEPIPDTIMYDQMPTINTGISSVNRSINQILPASEIVGSVNPIQIWIFIGAVIWLLGILILIAYGVVSYIKLKRKLLNSTIEQENIYYSDYFDTPFVMGIIKPKIFLPSFLSESEGEYILLHEQIHIKRRDHIVRFISYLVLSFHWFNPMVWIAFFMSEKDMEMSCDEAVIFQLGSSVKKEYSTSLLSLAAGRGKLSMSPLAFGEGETKGRIKNIIKFHKPKAYILAIVLLIITVVSIGLLVNPKNSLNERDIRIAMDEIKAEIMSINEADNGLGYEIIVTNNSSYTVYDLNLTLSYPIIIPNGSMTNLDGIEADHIIEKMESGSSEIVNVFIPSDYAYDKNVDTEKPEVHLLGYIGELKDTIRIEYIGRIKTISENDGEIGSLNSDDWIQEASSEPVQAVKIALINQEAKDYTISMSIGSVDIDEEETQRVVNRYLGSELAQSRGWSDSYLGEHFVVVKAYYTVEYDHTKTFMDDGYLEQYFYLTRDTATDLWSIIDNSTPTDVEIQFVSSENSLDNAISSVILDYNAKYWSNKGKAFENHVILKTESNEKDNTITVYCMALYNIYEYKDMAIETIWVSHIPIKLTFKVNDLEEYELVEYWEARDGSFYVKSIREAFPDDIEEAAINTQKYIVSQTQSSYQQAVIAFGIDTNDVIENLLEVIMSSPKESSNPGDYIDAHVIEYRELIYYGDYTIAYIERNRDPDASDLRERILEILYGEIAQHID